MHIFQKVILAGSIIIFCFTAFGCSNSEKSEKTNEFASKMKELIRKPNQESIALLSLKYKIDPNTIEQILDRYLFETDFLYRIMKKQKDEPGKRSQHDIEIASGLLDKTAYIELVNKISSEYAIESSIIASILFDYKLYSEAKDAAERSTSD